MTTSSNTKQEGDGSNVPNVLDRWRESLKAIVADIDAELRDEADSSGSPEPKLCQQAVLPVDRWKADLRACVDEADALIADQVVERVRPEAENPR